MPYTPVVPEFDDTNGRTAPPPEVSSIAVEEVVAVAAATAAAAFEAFCCNTDDAVPGVDNSASCVMTVRAGAELTVTLRRRTTSERGGDVLLPPLPPPTARKEEVECKSAAEGEEGVRSPTCTMSGSVDRTGDKPTPAAARVGDREPEGREGDTEELSELAPAENEKEKNMHQIML